jgi:type II pantothenate kinase
VDLLVRDLYGGDIDELAGDLTAANFGKSENAGRDDIALGIVRLIGENIALIVGSLAALHGVKTIVYAGSTLRSNDPLKSVLSSATAYRGGEATFLKDGEYSGAVGAMLMAER